MKINESQIRKIVRKALLEAPSTPAGMKLPDQTTSRRQQADNKVDDKRNASGTTALANLATNLLSNKAYAGSDGDLKTFLGILNGAQKSKPKDFESFMRNETIKSAYDKYNKDSAVPKKKSSGQASSKKKAPQKRKSSSFKFPVSDKVKAIQTTVGAPSSKTPKGADGKWGKNTSKYFAAWLKKQDFSKLKKASPAKTEEPKVKSGIVRTPAGALGNQMVPANENLSRRQLRMMINEILRTGSASLIKEVANKEQIEMIDANKNNPVAIAKKLGYTADLDGIENLIKDLSAGKDVGSSDDLGSSLSFEYEGVDYTQNTDSDGNVTYSEADSNETINDPELKGKLEDAAASIDTAAAASTKTISQSYTPVTYEELKKSIQNTRYSPPRASNKIPKLDAIPVSFIKSADGNDNDINVKGGGTAAGQNKYDSLSKFLESGTGTSKYFNKKGQTVNSNFVLIVGSTTKKGSMGSDNYAIFSLYVDGTALYNAKIDNYTAVKQGGEVYIVPFSEVKSNKPLSIS